MWDLRALATTFLEKVRWILGRTRSQKPSPVYREKQTLIHWEPRNVYYIEDDLLGEMLQPFPASEALGKVLNKLPPIRNARAAKLDGQQIIGHDVRAANNITASYVVRSV